MWNHLRNYRGGNFVNSERKNSFYDLHSKAVIKNHLRMYVHGNHVILWNENYDRFYLKIIFVLIPKIKVPYVPLCSCSLFSFSLDLSPSSPPLCPTSLQLFFVLILPRPLSNHYALPRTLIHSALTPIL